MQNSQSYKGQRSFEQRQVEAAYVQKLNPELVPIIVEKSNGSKLKTQENFLKYRLLGSSKLVHLLCLVKQQLQINQLESINLYQEKNQLPISDQLSKIYEKYRDSDGWLYLQYLEMNTFGNETINQNL